MEKLIWSSLDAFNRAYIDSTKRFTINRVSVKYELYDKQNQDNIKYYDSLQAAKDAASIISSE